MVCLAPILQYGLFLEHSLCRKQSNSVVLAASIFRELSDGYYNGLNNYLCTFGGSLLSLWYNGPRNPILIIKAPRLTQRAYAVKGHAGQS